MTQKELLSRQPRRGIRQLKKAALEARTIARRLKAAIKIHSMTRKKAEITRIGAMVAEITLNSVVVEVARITMIAEQLQETIAAVLGTSAVDAEETEERTKVMVNPDRIDVAEAAVTKLKEKAEEEVTVDEVVTMLAEVKVVEVIATTTSVNSLMMIAHTLLSTLLRLVIMMMAAIMKELLPHREAVIAEEEETREVEVEEDNVAVVAMDNAAVVAMDNAAVVVAEATEVEVAVAEVVATTVHETLTINAILQLKNMQLEQYQPNLSESFEIDT